MSGPASAASAPSSAAMTNGASYSRILETNSVAGSPGASGAMMTAFGSVRPNSIRPSRVEPAHVTWTPRAARSSRNCSRSPRPSTTRSRVPVVSFQRPAWVRTASWCGRRSDAPRESRVGPRSVVIGRSAESARDVVLGALVPGVGEDVGRPVELHEETGAVAGGLVGSGGEEGGAVRDACGLLHVVRDDDDRELLPEVEHQVLDAGG